MWIDRRLCDLLRIEHPLLLAPMAGSGTVELALAVAEAGGLAALACAMLTVDEVRRDVAIIRQRTARPLNLNFFVHEPPEPDPGREARWRQTLAGYYDELGLDPEAVAPAPKRAPFDTAMCEVVEDLRPEVVSFHFGLPEPALLARVRATGAKVLASATTVAEARWLAARGVDAVIAQGVEAGGHRGVFLGGSLASQPGLFALLPQVADAVDVPVIAAGGIGDGRGITAALALGAAGVQIGTAYLFCPEAGIGALHRAALAEGRDDTTALTNLFSGRPARGQMNRLMRELGPMSAAPPAFPLAGGALAPLKAAAERRGSADFSALWSGEAAALGRNMPAAELTAHLVRTALQRLRGLSA